MAWNSNQVQQLYASQTLGLLTRIGDRININPAPLAYAIKEIVSNEGTDPHSPEVLARAQEQISNIEGHPQFGYGHPAFGYVVQWVSEVGSEGDLHGLLRHAEEYLQPSWSNGGLYYTRNDAFYDDHGNYVHMEPFTGNAAIGYARLNVKYGQKKMWDLPWTKAVLEARSWIDGIGLEQGIDYLRGSWDDDKKMMIATFRSWDDKKVTIRPTARNLPTGTYGVYLDGELIQTELVGSNEDGITIEIEVGGDEVDLIILRA